MGYRNVVTLMARQSAKLIFFMVLAANIVTGNLAYAQAGSLISPSSIDIDDPRPVAKAVEMLVARYGYVITFEDPRRTYEGDLQDVTALVRNDLNKYQFGRVPKVTVPRGGRLTLQLPSSASATTQEMASVLDQLMRIQSRRSEGGHFRVIQDEDVFHILPTEVRDRNGNWTGEGSILDVPISLPKKARSEAEMIYAIVKAVSTEARVTVHIGSGIGAGISNPDRPQPYYLGADQERASNVLMRALLLLNDPKNGTWIVERLTWQMLYDSSDNAYFLNIAAVPDRLLSAPGVTTAQKIPQSTAPGSRIPSPTGLSGTASPR